MDSNFSASSLFPAARLYRLSRVNTPQIYTHRWWDLRVRCWGKRARNTWNSWLILSTPCYKLYCTAAEPRRLLQRRRRRIYLAAAIVLLFAHSQSSQANRLTVWPGGCVNHFFRTRIIYTICYAYIIYIYIYTLKYKYISYRLSSLMIFPLIATYTSIILCRYVCIWVGMISFWERWWKLVGLFPIGLCYHRICTITFCGIFVHYIIYTV